MKVSQQFGIDNFRAAAQTCIDQEWPAGDDTIKFEFCDDIGFRHHDAVMYMVSQAQELRRQVAGEQPAGSTKHSGLQVWNGIGRNRDRLHKPN